MRQFLILSLILCPVFISGGNATAQDSSAQTPSLFDRHVEEFIREHGVPGVAVAVTKNGKVVFARGYGVASRQPAKPVTNKSLFRIASLSKPVTAVAILQLVERSLIKMDSKVLEVLDLKKEIEEAGDRFDERWRRVTIRHLLEHRGGWDRGVSFDPMFQSKRFTSELKTAPPADQQTIIRAMLCYPLDYEPGQRYAYSNFGYCLLGRVVERLTGKTYEAYVQKNVLVPLSISSMKIGRTLKSGRAVNEVEYEHRGKTDSVFDPKGDPVPHPYGAWNLEAMDSHGAWIATATDLAKFAAAFDDPERCPILSAESIRLMHSRPPGLAGTNKDGTPLNPYYTLGWMNRSLGNGRYNYWHSGSLPGTATILIRRHDGLNFVGLVNSRTSKAGASIGGELDRMLHRAVNDSLKFFDR